MSLMPPHEVPRCARCGAPVPGVDAAEMGTVLAIFQRAPLLLCERCLEDNARERARLTHADGAGSKDGGVNAKGHAKLPPWPEEWPVRAIQDLDRFGGRPEAKARQMDADVHERCGTVAILGDRGRGKTVMATWLAEQRRQRGKTPGVYVRSHDLFATIRRSWHPQSVEDEWTVLERYRRTPFLVIDEFQERSESAWENRTLVNILDHRHGNILPTVLIANLSAEGFSESVGPSIVDRIRQTGGMVVCDWESLRR